MALNPAFVASDQARAGLDPSGINRGEVHDWKLALQNIALFAREAVAARQAGFTTDALNYPRCAKGLAALCAFNGIKPEQAPLGWHYYPNAGTKKAWERVVAALGDGA